MVLLFVTWLFILSVCGCGVFVGSCSSVLGGFFFFFFQAEDGIRDLIVTGVQTCALPIFEDAHAPCYAGARDDDLFRRSRRSRGGLRPAQLLLARGDEAGLRGLRGGLRSEERRVGKEGRSRWSPYH